MYKIFVYNFAVVNYIVEYRIMYISWSANIKNIKYALTPVY